MHLYQVFQSFCSNQADVDHALLKNSKAEHPQCIEAKFDAAGGQNECSQWSFH